jgi:hypothetical protein
MACLASLLSWCRGACCLRGFISSIMDKLLLTGASSPSDSLRLSQCISHPSSRRGSLPQPLHPRITATASMCLLSDMACIRLGAHRMTMVHGSQMSCREPSMLCNGQADQEEGARSACPHPTRASSRLRGDLQLAMRHRLAARNRKVGSLCQYVSHRTAR